MAECGNPGCTKEAGGFYGDFCSIKCTFAAAKKKKLAASKPKTISGPQVDSRYAWKGKYVDNCSSRIPRNQMIRFVETLMEKIIDFPVFSVCDCNCFHTSGHLWGLYAVAMLLEFKEQRGPVAVVNFDQHADAGSTTSGWTKSDGWGCPLMDDLGRIDLPACYLSTGNKKNSLTLRYSGARKTLLADQPKVYSEPEDFKILWKEINAYLGANIRYVFVSVDRDCLKKSYTQWQDGRFDDHNALDSYMRKVLDALWSECENNVRLIGFDVTGLPEHPMVSRPPSTITPEKAADRVNNELETFKKLIVDLDKKSEKMTKVPLPRGDRDHIFDKLMWGWRNVIFYNGSIAHESVKWEKVVHSWNWTNHVWWTARRLKKEWQNTEGKSVPWNWKYVLNQSSPPVMIDQWKEFYLYKPDKSIQVKSDLVKPGKKEWEKMKEDLGSGESLGGYACSASMRNTTSSYLGRLGKAGAPPPPKQAKLTGPDDKASFIRCSDPITQISGIRARLADLEYFNGPIGTKINEDLKLAVFLFEKENELVLHGLDEKTSKLNQETQKKLEEVFANGAVRKDETGPETYIEIKKYVEKMKLLKL
ncbi:hypothetical protein ACFL02_01180 [Planctomycetota bacterium]